jgi:ribosomal protein S12 methylthiotransferase
MTPTKPLAAPETTALKHSSESQASDSQKIGFVHLGCPKNLVDTEHMLGLLNEAGHTIVGEESDADVMLVNTCSFIEQAQVESVRNLVTLAEAGKKVVITGCLAQKFQDELLELIPEACAIVGTGDMTSIVDVVNRVQRGERVISMTQDPTYILEDDSKRLNITHGSYVYLKIAEGCDYRCSFCIIPSMRGDFRSRSLESIVEDAKRFVEKGVTEIILIGQDTTSYGKDMGTNLAKLLRALNDVEGLQWIRFMYAYPNLVSDELLETIAECDKVVKYLDCPLQHMHPEVLRRMRRPVMDNLAMVARIRAKIPNVKIRTGLIVGFPGETEEHFEMMCETIQEARFDRLGVFEYSDVEGAHSQSLDQKVPKKEIARRRRHIMALQQKIALENNQALIGQTLSVLVDVVDHTKGTFEARTQWDAPEVDNLVIGKGRPIPGDLVQVNIIGATAYDLKAELPH